MISGLPKTHSVVWVLVDVGVDKKITMTFDLMGPQEGGLF
jgi:hypothetical protein